MTKRILFLSAITILITSCGGGGDEQLDQLIAKRDSLQGERATLAEEISALDSLIVEMDTTIEKRITTVTTVKVKETKFEHFFEAHGTVETDQNIMIYPELAGEIKSIKVKEGDKVSKGQSLMSIDAEIIRKNLEQAEAAYELADVVFKRQSNLWKDKIGSEIQYLEAKNNRIMAEKQVEALRKQLEMASVTAPFSGVVDEIFPKEGEMAAPGMPLIRLVNLADLYIKPDISERYLSKVSQGSYVKIAFPSLDSMEIETTISRIGNYINPDNRTFKVQVDFKNKNNQAKPNLLAVLTIKDYERDSSLVIPTKLIQQDVSGQDYVFVAKKSGDKLYANKVVVTTGISHKAQTLILEGLKEDEEVIAEGARSVKDGEEIVMSKK